MMSGLAVQEAPMLEEASNFSSSTLETNAIKYEKEAIVNKGSLVSSSTKISTQETTNSKKVNNVLGQYLSEPIITPAGLAKDLSSLEKLCVKYDRYELKRSILSEATPMIIGISSIPILGAFVLTAPENWPMIPVALVICGAFVFSGCAFKKKMKEMVESLSQLAEFVNKSFKKEFTNDRIFSGLVFNGDNKADSYYRKLALNEFETLNMRYLSETDEFELITSYSTKSASLILPKLTEIIKSHTEAPKDVIDFVRHDTYSLLSKEALLNGVLPQRTIDRVLKFAEENLKNGTKKSFNEKFSFKLYAFENNE